MTSIVLLMTFEATPVLAQSVDNYPTGTIDVVQGQTFTLSHRLTWEDPANPGYYAITIYWDYLGDNAWHFTLDNTRAYFDNGDPVEATMYPPKDNGTRYTINVMGLAGDWNDDNFTVDITLRASGPDGTPHVVGTQPISYVIIRCRESIEATAYPAPVTIRVLGRGVAVAISPSENSGPPGTTLNYSVMVTNTGDIADNYALAANDNENWGLVLPDNWFEDVQPGENRAATLNVMIPENALGSTRDNITVRATGTGVENSASCTAHAAIVRGVKLSISPTYQENLPVGTLSYVVIVFNTGNIEDTYTLENMDNEGWTLTLDNTLLAIPLWENRMTTLDAIIPENAIPCTDDNITVTATSLDNEVSAENSCIAHTIILRGVRVLIDPSHDSDVPGETLTYTVTVTNTGNVADNYKLTISDNAVPSWNPTVSPTSLTITAGKSGTATLSVTILSGTEHGEKDNIQIVVTSMENAEVSASASCEAEASILRRVEVSISPGSGSGPPGTSLTYTVTVKNTGLVDDTYTLTAVGPEGWSVSISPTLIENLSPDENASATLSVVVPPDASEGTSKTVTVNVKSKGDPEVTERDTCRAIVTGVPEGPKVELPIPLAISVVLIGAAIIVPAYLLRGRPKKAARRRVLRDVSLGPRY